MSEGEEKTEKKGIQWAPIREAPYGRFKLRSERHELDFFFSAEDLEKALRYGYDLFVEEMLAFHCTGCHYCCHGRPSYAEACLRRFEDASELRDYFRLHGDRHRFNFELFLEDYEPARDGHGLVRSDSCVWSLSEQREAFLSSEATIDLDTYREEDGGT